MAASAERNSSRPWINSLVAARCCLMSSSSSGVRVSAVEDAGVVVDRGSSGGAGVSWES